MVKSVTQGKSKIMHICILERKGGKQIGTFRLSTQFPPPPQIFVKPPGGTFTCCGGRAFFREKFLKTTTNYNRLEMAELPRQKMPEETAPINTMLKRSGHNGNGPR